MSVELDAFRSAVANARNDSFIMMSQSKPDSIVNFGKTFLGRKLGWYHHATEAQNQQVREQLYLALVGDGKQLQSSTLERIRLQLGVDHGGKSSLTTQITAREIKQIIADTDTDNANVKARTDFCKELCKINVSAEMKPVAAHILGLDDPTQAIKPLTEADKEQLTANFKDECIEFFRGKLATVGISGYEELAALNPNDPYLAENKKTLDAGLKDGVDVSGKLPELVSRFNRHFMYAQHDRIIGETRGALAQFGEEFGVDISACAEKIVDAALDKAGDKADKLDTILKDATRYDDLINEEIAKLIQERKTIIRGILDANPRLEEHLEHGLINTMLTNLKVKDTATALFIAKHSAAVSELLEYSFEPNPTKAGMLAKFQNLDTARNELVEDLEARGDVQISSIESENINKCVIEVARQRHIALHGEPPRMTEPLKEFGRQCYAELEYFREHPKEGMILSKPYAYPEISTTSMGFSHVNTLLDSCFEAFGEEPPSNVPAAKGGLSTDLGDFMATLGIVAKRIRNPWGKTLDMKLGPAFMETFNLCYRKTGQRANNEKLGSFKEMFNEVSTDLQRTGTGLKLNGRVISRVGESEMIGGLDALKQFFDEDKTCGVYAARIMSDILNQGFAATMLNSIVKTGEGYGISLTEFKSHAIEFDVQRNEDGGYFIQANYTAIPNGGIDENGEIQYIDQARSRIDFKCTMSVTVEDGFRGKFGQVKLVDNPTLHAELYKTPFSEKEIDKMSSLVDEYGVDLKNAVMQTPELGNDEHFKALLAAKPRNRQAIYEYIQDKIILPKEDEVLYALGISNNEVDQLKTGLNPDTRLTKDLMKRLTDANEHVRAGALNELKALRQKLEARGWYAPRGELNPNDMTLATVGGLKAQSGAFNYTDLILTREYIKASNDEDVRGLPDALASNDPATLAAAKDRLKQVVLEARRAQGAKILWSIPEWHDAGNIELLENAPEDYQELIKRHLENVVQKSQFMEDSVSVLRATAAGLEKLAEDA